MKLVIAEKKSVATAIAQALCAAPVQRDGCYECGQLLVTWAQGHLIDLAMPEDYKDRDWRKWSLDTLPVDPSGHWQWKISQGRGARLPLPADRAADPPNGCGLPRQRLRPRPRG